MSGMNNKFVGIDQRKMWAIAYPGITWGGCMEIISTHRGSNSFFNQLIREINEKGNPKKISLHRVTLQDALDQGFLYKLQQALPADADPAVNPAADEICDAVDNDCDDLVDEDALDALDWYWDADGDGHGDHARRARGLVSHPG